MWLCLPPLQRTIILGALSGGVCSVCSGWSAVPLCYLLLQRQRKPRGCVSAAMKSSLCVHFDCWGNTDLPLPLVEKKDESILCSLGAFCCLLTTDQRYLVSVVHVMCYCFTVSCLGGRCWMCSWLMFWWRHRTKCKLMFSSLQRMRW